MSEDMTSNGDVTPVADHHHLNGVTITTTAEKNLENADDAASDVIPSSFVVSAHDDDVGHEGQRDNDEIDDCGDENGNKETDTPAEDGAAGGGGAGAGGGESNVIITYDVNDPDLTCNRENPDEEDEDVEEEEEEDRNDGNKPHNRSHDSIESQRTIIEADDFSSFLAQDDDDDDDFGDENLSDDGLGLRGGGDDAGGFMDISALMSATSNSYMLDFTTSSMIGGESEAEGNNEGEEEEDEATLSGRSQRGESDEGHSTPRGENQNQSKDIDTSTKAKTKTKTKTKKRNSRQRLKSEEADRGVRKVSSWVKATAPFHGAQGQGHELEASDSDDDDAGSPPRNFREEINNNIQKAPPSVVPPLMLSSSSSLPSSIVASHSSSLYPHSHHGGGNIDSNNILPSKPIVPTMSRSISERELQQLQQQQQQQQQHFQSSDLEANLSPRYNTHHHQQQLQQFQHQHHLNHSSSQQQQPAAAASSPGSKVPTRFQTYEYERPLRSARYSGSLENLFPNPTNFGSDDDALGGGGGGGFGFETSSSMPPHTHALSQDDEEVELRRQEWQVGPTADDDGGVLSKQQRRNSAPNLYEAALDHQQQLSLLCRNCQFSKDDYLFKIRLLQTQLEKTEKELKKKDVQWQHDLADLKKDNEKQQKIISQSLALGPEAKIEITMQHEITRLTSENLDLRESIDKQMDQMRKLKKMLKVYAKKLKDGEAAEIAAELENEESASSNSNLASVIHRERAYMGMMEYKKEDEAALTKNLILDLKPKVASSLIPGLPAYILFMCVRHTDYVNDDDKVKTLLTSTINSIKKVVKRHSDDLERITLWLANTCRLLHTLKQYSGDKQFQAENATKQNEQCLRNFDLSEYRQVFSDLAVWNYQALMKLMEELIQPNIVPAILEHEAIAGLTASKPSGLRGRASSNAKELDDESSHHSLDSLMRTLNSYMKIVKQHAVDPELVKQIFRQLFYFMCAGALNNLLLRKDMCNWSKGMQIRYNLSHLEQWLRDNSLHEFGAQAALDPIIQASQLLQARKTESDVESICDMCSKLTTAQIVKILNIYTPVDDFEERVPIAFIRKIQAKLKQRSEEGGPSTVLLMDTKYSYPVTFPFNPSSVTLETTAVPEQLHLGFLIRH